MIVEIGHFYTNEFFDANQLGYLREQKFNLSDELILFIDDYTDPSDNLNIPLLKRACEEVLGRSVKVEYESEMVKFFDSAIMHLSPNKLKKISVNDIPTELLYDDRKIFDYKTNRPSCQMLSFIWTLFRLNVFKNKTGGDDQFVLTVIDKKYFKLEQRVFSMIPLIHRNKIFYRYF